MICSLDELGLQTDRAEWIFPLETVWDDKILEKHLGKPFGTLSLTLPGHDGNIEYAILLLKKSGSQPWSASKPCWGDHVAMR
jgi:hypothetical protein